MSVGLATAWSAAAAVSHGLWRSRDLPAPERVAKGAPRGGVHLLTVCGEGVGQITETFDFAMLVPGQRASMEQRAGYRHKRDATIRRAT